MLRIGLDVAVARQLLDLPFEKTSVATMRACNMRAVPFRPRRTLAIEKLTAAQKEAFIVAIRASCVIRSKIDVAEHIRIVPFFRSLSGEFKRFLCAPSLRRLHKLYREMLLLPGAHGFDDHFLVHG